MRITRFQILSWLLGACVLSCATTSPETDALPALACHDLQDCRARCENNDRSACTALTLMLSNGARDSRQSASFKIEDALQRGCTVGDANACSQLGDLLLESLTPSSRPRAVDSLSKACNKAVARACVQLGGMYARGDASGRVEEPKALALYEQACTLGHPVACNRVGIMYESGRAVPQDAQRALTYYRAGCERQSAEACTNEAILLVTTSAILPGDDFHKVHQLFRKGCEGGDERACLLLANTPG